jgi:hypothetical protein
MIVPQAVRTDAPGARAAAARTPASPELPPSHAPGLPLSGLGLSAGSHGGASSALLFLLAATIALTTPTLRRRLYRIVDSPVPSGLVAVPERPG